MFHPSPRSARRTGNSSESESDWDTTDVPSPHQTANSDMISAAQSRDLHDPPTPRTRVSLTGSDMRDVTGDGAPDFARRDGAQPSSATRDTGKLSPASSYSGLHLPLGESGSRHPSPVPPFMSGFRDAVRSDDDTSKEEPPSLSKKTNKGGKYEHSPSPQRRIPVDAEMIPNWDDSEAEQQTLRELHTTFKKEKKRETENESARREFQDEGNQFPAAGQNTSVLEKWMQGQEEKRRQKNTQGSSPTRKTGVSSPSSPWTKGGELALPEGAKPPYQSFLVRDQEGRRFLYFFNEGNTSFYEVEEEDISAFMPGIAEKVEGFIQRGWQEFFGVLRILTSVVILLCIEAFQFITNHVARPLLLALVVTLGNHFLKPVLAGLFNFVLQPLLIFLWNVLSGVRHALQPLIDIVGAVMSKVAILLQAFRLVEVNGRHCGSGDGQGLRVMGLGRGARSDSEIV